MIRRTADPAEVNTLAGADLTEFLAEPLHVCLIEDESCGFFAWRGPGIYELHLFFAVRGRAAMDLLIRMLAMVRSDYGGRLFWAMVPQEDRKTRLFARSMGWKSLGPREDRHGAKELFVSEICPCLLSQS